MVNMEVVTVRNMKSTKDLSWIMALCLMMEEEKNMILLHIKTMEPL
jgi:hypothetical protein